MTTRRTDLSHSFILRDPNKCINCTQCVRVCHDVIGPDCYGMFGKGFDTIVSTPFNVSLHDTDCVSCGACVQVCPTGSLMMAERTLTRWAFALDRCIFCGDCVEVCPHGALGITPNFELSFFHRFGEDITLEKGDLAVSPNYLVRQRLPRSLKDVPVLISARSSVATTSASRIASAIWPCLGTGISRRTFPWSLQERKAAMENHHRTSVSNVLVIGSGGAGLRAAIAAYMVGCEVTIVGKRQRKDAHTVLAAGGINAVLGTADPEDSWEQHFADTLVEGYFLSHPRTAEILAREAPSAVLELAAWGAHLPGRRAVNWISVFSGRTPIVAPAMPVTILGGRCCTRWLTRWLSWVFPYMSRGYLRKPAPFLIACKKGSTKTSERTESRVSRLSFHLRCTSASTAATICRALMPAASSNSAGVPEPGMDCTASLTISGGGSPRREKASNTASPSPPSGQWSSTTTNFLPASSAAAYSVS